MGSEPLAETSRQRQARFHRISQRESEGESEAGTSSLCLRFVDERLGEHPPIRRSMGREHRQWVLRRLANGSEFPAQLRSGIPEPVGHGGQLAGLGTGYCCESCEIGFWLFTVAEHGQNVWSALKKEDDGFGG